MSIRINTKCPHAASCKYGDGCLMVKSAHEGGTYDPVLKIRLIDLKKQVRCFSYAPKNKEEADGNKKYRDI